jgi:SAM-dependent methyltransferase
MEVTIEAIRDHYDSMAQVYRLFWGEHLHHGLFINGDERPRKAQEQMLEFCVRLLALAPGAAVLDVGCGYGGTAVYLARDHDAHVTGIRNSQGQRCRITCEATKFLRDDGALSTSGASTPMAAIPMTHPEVPPSSTKRPAVGASSTRPRVIASLSRIA